MSEVELLFLRNLRENSDSNPPIAINESNIIEIFDTRDYKEVIKNPGCAFVNEDNSKNVYYFCLCSEKAYFPICESCAFNCHKDHNPEIKIEGFFICNCSSKNHRITQKSQKQFEEKSKFPKKCFYTEFYEKSYNKGFYKIPNGKYLCSICYFSEDCNSNIKDNCENFSSFQYGGICQCENHYEINVVTLSNELNKNIDFSKFLLGFNFNIISICETPKLIFIDFLNEKINELIKYKERRQNFENNPSNLLNKNNNTIKNFSKNLYSQESSSYIFNTNKNKDPFITFNTDFVIFTLFNILKLFKKDYSSQYLHVKNFFNRDIKPFDLIDILKQTVDFKRLLDHNENIELYFKTKANFAFMIYHVYIKSHFLGHNNLLNLKSMLNLNIVQRMLYIHQSKKFYKFAYYSDILNFKVRGNNIEKENQDIPLYTFEGKLEKWEFFIFEFSNEIINIIETMLQVHDNFPIIKNVLCDVMVTFGKIMKFIIKYNLIDDHLKTKYFEIILNSLVAFVNEIDESDEEYLLIIKKLADNYIDKQNYDKFLKLKHREKIRILSQNSPKHEIEKLNEIFLQNESLKDNLWFVFPAIKSIFYYMIKKNDDLVIMKLKGQYSKTQSQEKYCFISSSEFDMLSKIFLLSLKIFNENSYRDKDEESVYKNKILKFDLYAKKILELLNGNSEFYLKSLESIIHQYQRKIDSIFIQDLGEKSNNPEAYKRLMNTSNLNENNILNKTYSKLNMKILTSDEDYHMEILKTLNLELYIEFNKINQEFGDLNKKFYEYDIDFREFTNCANNILERFQIFFKGLDGNPTKIKTSEILKKETILSDNNNFKDNKIEHINNILSKDNRHIDNNFNKDKKIEYINNNLINKNIKVNNYLEIEKEEKSITDFQKSLKKKNSLIIKNPTSQKLYEFKQIMGYTDFLENFNEFLDIYARSKAFDKNLNAIKIQYDLLKFILNLLYVISDGNNENLVLIMTINPNKLVDAFYDYREELCILLNRLAKIVSKFDYNDNYFFLTDFMNRMIDKLEVNEEYGMSKEDFLVLTSILKSFKKLLPKYNLYNNELINTYEIINSKIMNIKNNHKMIKRIKSFINNLVLHNGKEKVFYWEKKQENFHEDENLFNESLNKNLDQKMDYNMEKNSKNNCSDVSINNNPKNNSSSYIVCNSSNNLIKENLEEPQVLILNENKISNFDESFNMYNTMKIKYISDLKTKNNHSEKPDIKCKDQESFTCEEFRFDSFFKHYFALLNIGFDKDLYYYDLFYDKEIIILDKFQIKDIINNSKNLNIAFREEVERFLHNYNLKSKIKFSTVEREFTRFQRKSNSEKGKLNYIFSAKYKETLNFSCDILEIQIKNFFINCGLSYLLSNNYFGNINEDFLRNQYYNKSSNQKDNSNLNSGKYNNEFSISRKNTNTLLIQKISNSQNNTKIINNLKINSIYSYLENAIISPMYKILNLYMIDKENLKGEDYYVVYKLVFYLHQVLFSLYNLDLKNLKKQNIKSKIKNQKSSIKLNYPGNFVSISKYFYGDLKQKLNGNYMKYLEKNLNKLKNLKYFQFEEIINIFRVTLAMIKKNNILNYIHLRKKFYRFYVIENSSLGCYEEINKDKIFLDLYNQIINEATNYFLNPQEKILYGIIEEYKKILSETYGNKFSLIKVLESKDLDCDVDLTGILLKYIINKIADKLTRANQKYYIPQNVFTFDNFYKMEKTNSKNNDVIINDVEDNCFHNSNLNKDHYLSKSDLIVKMDKNYVEGKNLKMQNFYMFFFLRNLFYFDPGKFQEALINLFTVVKRNNFKKLEKSVLNSDLPLTNNKFNILEIDVNLFKRKNSKSKSKNSSQNNILNSQNLNIQIDPKKLFDLDESSSFIESDEEGDLSEQEEVMELDKDKIHYFLSILNKYFIFGNILCEAGKLFELYNERTLIRSNFIYDLLVTNIFLMQNICEGHNPITQELLFDLRLKPLFQETKEKLIEKSSQNTYNDILKRKEKSKKYKNNTKVDNEHIKLDEFLKNRNDFCFSYINFLSNLMRNIVGSLYFDFDDRYVFINKTFSLNSNFIHVYSKLTNLLIEMIQGTKEHNLFNFYLPLKKKVKQLIPSPDNIDIIKNDLFLVFLNDIKQVFIKKGVDHDKEFCVIKTLAFSILNNILNQETVNHDFVRMLMKIFDIEFLMGKLIKYMKKLILKFQKKILYEHPQFVELEKKIKLENFKIEDFYQIFLIHQELAQDDYFELCVQIFYFINITGDKFYMQESIDILELNDINFQIGLNKNYHNDIQRKMISTISMDLDNLEIENTFLLKTNRLENKIKFFFEKTLKKKSLFDFQAPKIGITENKGKNLPFNDKILNTFRYENKNKLNNKFYQKQKENQINGRNLEDYLKINKHSINKINDIVNLNENEYLEPKNYTLENLQDLIKYDNSQIKKFHEKDFALSDIIYTKQFFSKIINSVEFVIEDESGGKVKEIYFIKSPIGNLINETNIINFFKKADRKDATTKITYMLDSLENFLIEIDYQLNIKNEFKKFLLKYDYKFTDLLSFIISIIINFLLIGSLDSESIDNENIRMPLFKVVRIAGLAQILINFISLIIFLIVKQDLWITYEINNIRRIEFSYMGNSIIDREIILTKINLFRKIRLFFIDSFLINEEIILINFNILLGIIGISQFYATMIFSLQLLTVVRFVETIRDILLAFRSRFDQLVAMVFFLLFLIYFYTNVAFYFLNSEYLARGIGPVIF